MQWFGKPVVFNRFLGQVDQDDPTNLPIGLAAICRNVDFTRDSPGVTNANTRAGNNLTMQGINRSPITGLQQFVYSPQLPGETNFQLPTIFDMAGALQYENPVGTGSMNKVPQGLFVPPNNSHMIAAQAGNNLFAAFSNLLNPTSGMACFNPKTLSLNPLGMKPFGWTWQPNTAVLVGEMCTPPTPVNGNGHTYRCIQAGVTGANTPVFPLTEAAEFNDGTAIWQELTMVIANRLPPPAAPVLNVTAGGTFPAGTNVWIVITLTNDQGETLPSIPALAAITASGSEVQVILPTLASMAGWIRGLAAAYIPNTANVYVASVAAGSPAPALSSYQEYASGQALGSTVVVTADGTGFEPPTLCTARVTPGQLPTPDVEPEITRDASAGAFPAGRDVYVLQTYTNSVGETKAGPANSIVNTDANDAVQVTVAVPEDDNGVALYTISSVGIYEADVPTGQPAPPSTAFSLVGYYQAGATPLITASATGPNPPTANTTGPGGNIAADTPTGGVNGGQGYRYAAAMFMNQNETVSGFTLASVVQTIIDEDGWEIGVFNVATGPSNTVGLVIAFTEADGTQAGPFNYIGLVDLIVPSQNFVYPDTLLSDGITISASVFLDNVTTQGTLNFTDEYLIGSEGNDVTDRLRVEAPPQAVRVDYLESVDRLALTGVPGYTSGCVISLGEDYESYYGDTSPVPIAPNGEVCWGVTDKYKGIPFAIRSKSGYVLTPNTGDPSSWDATKRWDEVGACGPRAWAACGKFIIFVDQAEGIIKYDESDPDLMTKEIPRMWGRINWLAAQTICVTIDEDTHTVRVQVPVGNSMVPNLEICLSYLEGWQNPIHFSTFSGKEISMDAARRYSFNDFCAFVCARVLRTIPNPPSFVDGPAYVPRLDRSFYVSQLLYGSSAADGAVNARTPGIFSDNGAGIDYQYQTMSASMMQATCKAEGFNLNATGNGRIYAWFVAARDMVIGNGGLRGKALACRPIDLTPDQKLGITRKVPPKINEYWSVLFTNGKQPGAWVSLKAMTVYMIPWSGGRGELDK